jgi:hypothetical protein
MFMGFQVTFDAHDPAALSRFWALALDYVEQPPPPGHDTWEDFARSVGIPEDEWGDLAAIVDPNGAGPRVLFQKVPEGKTAKNRVHLDVNVGGPHGTPPEERKANVAAKVAALETAGATKGDTFDMPDRGDYWVVMRDPEGNEFCVQ